MESSRHSDSSRLPSTAGFRWLASWVALDDSEFTPIQFEVVKGSILSIAWDFGLLPYLPSEWEHGLNIHRMGFNGDSHSNLHLPSKYLPYTEQLVCSNCNLSSLRLRGLASLIRLDCSNNNLIKLDLQDSKQLEVLMCGGNQLAHYLNLGLSENSALRILDCSEHNLNALDLSFAPNPVHLNASNNEIAEIDLNALNRLISLNCNCNRLVSFGRSLPPSLLELRCSQNYLERIELGNSSAIKTLHCKWNRLNELNLASNPDLDELQCQGNPLTSVATTIEQRSLCTWYKDTENVLDAAFAFYAGSSCRDSVSDSENLDEEDEQEWDDEDDDAISAHLASRYSPEQLIYALYAVTEEPQIDGAPQSTAMPKIHRRLNHYSALLSCQFRERGREPRLTSQSNLYLHKNLAPFLFI